MPLSAEIQSLIARFATDVEALVRTAAVAAVTDALGGDVAASLPRVAAKAATPRKVAKRATVAKPAATTAKAKPAVARAVRVRRSADDIEATATKIVDYVKANPGSKAEQIKAALKLPSNQWSAPVKVALESKRLTVRGEKRASSYSVPGGAVPPIKRAAK